MDSNYARQYDSANFTRVPQMIPANANQCGPLYGQRRSAGLSPASQPDLDSGENAESSQNYGYAQGQPFTSQVQSNTLHYNSGFGPETTRQQFQTYPPNLLYGLPTASSQSTEYESVPQFQGRHSTSLDTLPNQLGVSNYFQQSDQTGRGSQQSQRYDTGDYQQAAQYSQRTSVTSSTTSAQYIPGATDYSSLSIPAIMDPGEQSRHSKTSDNQFGDFYNNLRRSFRAIKRGDLLQAAHDILQISDWTSSHAVDLGLTRDDQVSHEERIEFWESLNTCWLALLQKQKDSSQEMIHQGHPPPAGQTIMQEDLLERMARELVRVCDVMERYGLVDYQIGIWEEEIMNVLLECLQILEGDLEDFSTPEIPSRQSATREAKRRAV